MGEYEIIPYSSDFLNESADLLKILWNRASDERLEYFKWKYEDNPYTDRPLGILALHVNKVVGFRGYCATPWQAHGNEFMALITGDTVVEKSHRRRGLSMRMGKFACKEYTSNYKFFLNMEANQKATSGYLKLGFQPLSDKRTSISFAKVDKSEIEQVVVSNIPDFQRMQPRKTIEISLNSNSNFLRWRYKTKIPYNYRFYYHEQDYVVTGQLPSNDTAHILDYTENNIESFEIILKRIKHTPSVVTLSIRTINLSEDVSNVLKKLKFKDNNIKNKNLRPVLVRPTSPNPIEEDWFINGLDIRKIDNWKLKGICSEWA